MESLLLVLGLMFVLVLLIQGHQAAIQDSQPIVVIQSRPEASGCLPFVAFLLGLIVAALLLGGGLLR